MLPLIIRPRSAWLAAAVSMACGAQADPQEIVSVPDPGAESEKAVGSSGASTNQQNASADAVGTGSEQPTFVDIEPSASGDDKRQAAADSGIDVPTEFFSEYYPPGELVRDEETEHCLDSLPVERLIARIAERYDELDDANGLVPAVIDPFTYGVTGFVSEAGELGLVFHQEEPMGHSYHYFVVTTQCEIAKLQELQIGSAPNPEIRIIEDYDARGEPLWGVPWPRPLPHNLDLPVFWRGEVAFEGFAKETSSCGRGAEMFSGKLNVEMVTDKHGVMTLSGTPNQRINGKEIVVDYETMIASGDFDKDESRGEACSETMHIEVRWLPGEALLMSETSSWACPEKNIDQRCKWEAHGFLMAPE